MAGCSSVAHPRLPFWGACLATRTAECDGLERDRQAGRLGRPDGDPACRELPHRRDPRRSSSPQRAGERPAAFSDLDAGGMHPCTPPGERSAGVGDGVSAPEDNSQEACRSGPLPAADAGAHASCAGGSHRSRDVPLRPQECNGSGRPPRTAGRPAGVRTRPRGPLASRRRAALSRPYSRLAGGYPSAAGGSPGAEAASERMSMRHPVRRAARRAFCPSRPMARDSW